MNHPIGRVLLIVAVVGSVMVAPGAVAAGRVKGRSGHPSASLAFDPNPAVAGAQYQVNGSGFRPNTWITVGAHYDTVYWTAVITDSSGSFSLTTTAAAPGEILHEAKQQTKSGRLRLMATATLTVVAG